MKCPICGTEHNEKFCPGCGQRAAWDWNEINKQNEEGIRRTDRKRKLRRYAGLIAFIALLLLSVLLMTLDGGQPDAALRLFTEIF